LFWWVFVQKIEGSHKAPLSNLPETELLEFCKEKGIVFLAFAPLGHGMRPGLLENPVISAIAARVGKTPASMGDPTWYGCADHA
jgi:aryl-alcohol dehydrogenase-like predicted oxidoreductase